MERESKGLQFIIRNLKPGLCIVTLDARLKGWTILHGNQADVLIRRSLYSQVSPFHRIRGGGNNLRKL